MLTTTQAAALLGIKSAMARRYCEKGRLAATQVGGRWITTREAVEAFRPTMNKPGRPRKDETMRITKKLEQFIDGYNSSDDMLVVETGAPAGWGRPNTLNYCLERPGTDTSHGRVLGTVAEVKAAIAERKA